MVRLRPAAHPVRRAPGEVQFGLSPTSGIVLAGLTEAECKLLLSLADTAGTARDVSLAERFGVPLHRVIELVAALRRHGLLVGEAAPAPARRICVPGRGSVVDLVREYLSAADVGVVIPAEAAVAAAVDLALVCSADAVAPDEGRVWQRVGTAHLPVVLRDGEVVVGPLVHPGRSACLHCLDLHRRDRDRAWPRILSQIGTPTRDLARAVDAPTAQARTVAALVAMLAQECLATPTAVLGVSWQVSLPWPEVRTRVWEPHPHCACLARRPPSADRCRTA
jgi:bacteriocin biosynthesis cyclodehydratase domain-containing protein